jgi:hypothetical protein
MPLGDFVIILISFLILFKTIIVKVVQKYEYHSLFSKHASMETFLSTYLNVLIENS